MSDGLSAIQNRYRDVVPCKRAKSVEKIGAIVYNIVDNKNRIRLKDNPSGDYINASMLTFSDVERRYIAGERANCPLFCS